MKMHANPYPSGPAAGHVEVWVEDLHPDTATVTVVRIQQGRQYPTRGFVDSRADSDLHVRDFEAPFGLHHEYRATGYDRAGEIIEVTESPVVFLQHSRASAVVIHDPVRPARRLTLTLGKDALRGGARTLSGSTVSTRSSSLPITINGVRGGWVLALDVVTYSDAQAEQLDAMFGGYDAEDASGVLCFRPSANVPSSIPRTFFGRVEEPTPMWWPGGDGNGNPRADWALRATEVRPPSPALYEPLVTWADLQAWIIGHGGWAGLPERFGSFAELNRSLLPLGAAAAAKRSLVALEDAL